MTARGRGDEAPGYDRIHPGENYEALYVETRDARDAARAELATATGPRRLELRAALRRLDGRLVELDRLAEAKLAQDRTARRYGGGRRYR